MAWQNKWHHCPYSCLTSQSQMDFVWHTMFCVRATLVSLDSFAQWMFSIGFWIPLVPVCLCACTIPDNQSPNMYIQFHQNGGKQTTITTITQTYVQRLQRRPYRLAVSYCIHPMAALAMANSHDISFQILSCVCATWMNNHLVYWLADMQYWLSFYFHVIPPHIHSILCYVFLHYKFE